MGPRLRIEAKWLGCYNDFYSHEAKVGEFLRFVVPLLCHIIGQ
jgi:hypothetical protein